MKLVPFVLLLLVALTGSAFGLFRKKHVLVSAALNWADARTHCRSNYVEMSTLNTMDDFYYFKGDVPTCVPGWIGLSRVTVEDDYTQWSDGSPLTVTNWHRPISRTGTCVQVSNYDWYNVECQLVLPVYCYTWDPQLIVVPETKTWHEAREHCRTYHTDLLSVSSDADLALVNRKTSDGQAAPAWVGLRFMDRQWFWVNNDSLGSLVGLSSCPHQPFHCGAKNGANALENRHCEERLTFICYHRTG